MVSNNLISSFDDYKRNLKLALKNNEQSEDKISESAIPSLEKLSKSLQHSSGSSSLKIILEMDHELRQISNNISSEQNKKINLLTLNMLEIIDESILDAFFLLGIKEQEEFLKDANFLKDFKAAIRSSNQKRVRNREGDLLFHLLLRSGSHLVRKFAVDCVECGADIDQQNRKGLTGLHIAAQIGDDEMIKTLVSLGADLSILSFGDKRSALDFAILAKNKPSIMILASTNPLQKFNGEPILKYFLIEMSKQNSQYRSEDLVKILDRLDPNSLKTLAKTLWEGLLEPIQQGAESKLDESLRLVKWLLDKEVTTEESFEDQIIVLGMVANLLLERSFSGKYDEQIVQSMLDRGFLPLIMSDNDQSILGEIIDKTETIHLSDHLVEKLKETYQKIPLEEFAYLYQILFSIKDNEDITSLLKNYSKMQESLKKLKEQQFPHIYFVEKNIKKELKNEMTKVENYLRIKTQLEEDESVDYVDKDLHELLMEEFVRENRWELIPRLQRKRMNVTKEFISKKITAHLVMDKLYFENMEMYTGFISSFTANALLRTINRLKVPENIDIPKLKEIAEQIKEEVTPLLEEYIIESSMRDSSPLVLSQRVQEKLENLTAGSSLLVPTGCSGHATSLLINKNSDGSFSLTHYNTGKGVMEWHPQWEKTNRYQTFLTIDNIPEESIFDPKAWDDLFEYSLNSLDIENVYRILIDKLGADGIKAMPSGVEEDYEAKQASGTCAMQSLMAFLRHRIMSLADATPAEKEAIYKLYKNQLFSQFLLDHLSDLDENIKSNLVTMMEKLKADLLLVELVKTPEEYSKAMKTIGNMFSAIHREDIFKKLSEGESTTTLGRYAQLRKALNTLCVAWSDLSYPPVSLNAEQKKILNLAITKFEHHVFIKKNIKARIEESAHKSREDLAVFLSRVLTSTAFPELVIEEFVNRFGGEEMPYENTNLILRKFNGYRKQTEKYVYDIVKRLEHEGELDQAEWMRSAWQLLK
ncbi:MAG: hypothetical protein Tsb0021_11520 [Chlamydiales bacterium]